jgi:hypothetical protein
MLFPDGDMERSREGGEEKRLLPRRPTTTIFERRSALTSMH